MTKLTKTIVEAASTHDKEFLWDDDVRGFGIRFLTSGRRVWVYRYRDESNRWRQLKLGEVGVLSLALAREQARSAAAKVQMGGSPAAERDAKRRALSVRSSPRSSTTATSPYG